MDTFFLILVLLQFKHWYIDFVNQTNEEIQHKGIYFDWRGVKHSLKHGLGTFVVFLPFADLEIAFLLGLIDFLIHYHIDWAKIKITQKYNYTTQDKKYWAWFGADQLAHQLTYIFLMVLTVI